MESPTADFIRYRPGWIVRNGTGLFLLLVLALFGISFFVPYPTVLEFAGRTLSDSPVVIAGGRYDGALAHQEVIFEDRSGTSPGPISNGRIDSIFAEGADSVRLVVTAKNLPLTVTIRVIRHDQHLSDMLIRQAKEIFSLH